MSEDLFCIEAPLGFQYAMNFGDGLPPGGDVVYNAEVEHCVVGRVGFRDGACVARPDGDGVAVSCGSASGQVHHVLIEVEGVNVLRMENPQYDLDSNTTTAADFECGPTLERTAEREEASRYEMPLDTRPKRTVHHYEL